MQKTRTERKKSKNGYQTNVTFDKDKRLHPNTVNGLMRIVTGVGLEDSDIRIQIMHLQRTAMFLRTTEDNDFL